MNTQSDFNNVIIDLKPLQALKLDLFKTAIREPINYDVFIGGFLDNGLICALIQLLEEARISLELCEVCASLLPDRLRDKLHF
jgi:hypothetical protein